MSRYRFGIDMGGTSVKMGLMSPAGEMVWQTSVNSGGDSNPDHLVKKIASAAIPMVSRHRLRRVGVGVAGDIDFEKGTVRFSPNLNWRRVHLKKLFKKYMGCEAVIDNDANVASWGLYKTQAPKSVKNLVVLTLGTGVGGGIVLDGHIHRGATGSAGEIGHMIMNPQGPLCNCGQRGCLEAYAGGLFFARRVRHKLANGAKSSLQSLYDENPAFITPHSIFMAAKKGDAFAQTVWQDVGSMLGRAIGDLIYILNPQLIFLTGGVAQAGELLLTPLFLQLKTRSFKTPIAVCPIRIAKSASNMGIIGAALL